MVAVHAVCSDILAEKWTRFGGFLFWTTFLAYLAIVCSMTAALLMTNDDPNNYSGRWGGIRLVLEIVVVAVVILETTFELPGGVTSRGGLFLQRVAGVDS